MNKMKETGIQYNNYLKLKMFLVMLIKCTGFLWKQNLVRPNEIDLTA